MKGKPITFTRTGIDGEEVELDDGYEPTFDDFEEDYPDDTESRLELLKIIQKSSYFIHVDVKEETEFRMMKLWFFEYCEEKLFDVEFSEQAKREISTVGELIDYLIEQGV